MSDSQSAATSYLCCSEDSGKAFWRLWEQYRDYLYRCCLKWMDGNPTHAEDALSRAMLKAWEKFQDSTGAIANFKAWLTKLTHNLCVDIHREYNRGARGVESVEAMALGEEVGLVSQYDTPEIAVLRHELATIIYCAIDDLPPRLREPCVLHFIQEKSYQDIVQQLAISYDNLCKRLSQARIILQKRLRRYLSGLDNSLLDSSQPSGKRGKSGMERSPSARTLGTYAEIPPTPLFKGGNDSSPNYQVTAICLETLPHAWYQSLSLLGWS